MRAGSLVVLFGLILLVVLAGQTFPHDNQANLDPPVVAACSVQGQGCAQPTLDGGRQSILSHRVFTGGCPHADLHVMKYLDDRQQGSAPIVASWCS